MKHDVLTLDAGTSGDIELDESIFGVAPRADILHRVVRWQLAKRQAGTHATKGRSDVSYSTKKIYRQKGTGGARHGARSAPIFRGGGVYKGPTPRSHAHELPKKVRALGLKMALSDKAASDRLIVIDSASLKDGKTKSLKAHLEKLGVRKALFIDGDVDDGFARAARNLDGIDVLPGAGANVYDIMLKDTLVVTRAGIDALTARLASQKKEDAA